MTGAAAREAKPLGIQVVYAASGMILGEVTPYDDGTWSARRYGHGRNANRIHGVSEVAAADYVANGEELGDGPKPHPVIEAIWEEQEGLYKAGRESRSPKA